MYNEISKNFVIKSLEKNIYDKKFLKIVKNTLNLKLESLNLSRLKLNNSLTCLWSVKYNYFN